MSQRTKAAALLSASLLAVTAVGTAMGRTETVEVAMRQASFDNKYTWVRVEGPRQVSDLFVPAMQEAECQVERIAR